MVLLGSVRRRFKFHNLNGGRTLRTKELIRPVYSLQTSLLDLSVCDIFDPINPTGVQKF